jgi:hypothetical protein
MEFSDDSEETFRRALDFLQVTLEDINIFSYSGFIVLVTRFFNRSHSCNSFIVENRSKMRLPWPRSQSQYIHGDIKDLDVEA